MNTYEAMFLFDPSYATDLARVEQEVGRLAERAGAEIIMARKWDERKLAYEIKGRKRGCYFLAFFRAEPDKIVGMERDAQLSEPILRLLILRADHMTEEAMQGAYLTRSEPASAAPEKPSGPPAGDKAPAADPDAKGDHADLKPTPEAVPDSAVAAETESPAGEATETATDEPAAE